MHKDLRALLVRALQVRIASKMLMTSYAKLLLHAMQSLPAGIAGTLQAYAFKQCKQRMLQALLALQTLIALLFGIANFEMPKGISGIAGTAMIPGIAMLAALPALQTLQCFLALQALLQCLKAFAALQCLQHC